MEWHHGMTRMMRMKRKGPGDVHNLSWSYRYVVFVLIICFLH